MTANVLDAPITGRADEMMATVQAARDIAFDANADTRALRVLPTEGTDSERPGVVLAAGDLRYEIGDLAHDQMAERVKIPKDYYRRMLATQPELLAQNLNTWLHAEPDVRFLRFIGPATDEERERMGRLRVQGRLRAVLGRTYRAIDHGDVLAAVLPVAARVGATLKEYTMDDRRFYAKFVLGEGRTVEDIRAEYAARAGITVAELNARHGHVMIDGRDIAWVNETLRAGLFLRNSETGFAALEVTGMMEVLKCLNAYIATAQTKTRHAGNRRHVEEEGFVLSEATTTLDDAALLSRITDAATAAFDEVKAAERVEQIIGAKLAPDIAPPDNEPFFAFVEKAGRGLGLPETRLAEFQDAVSDNVVIEGGRRSPFAVAQAVTAFAKTLDYDRQVELEREGWAIVERGAQRVLALARAGAKVAKTN